MRVTRPMLTTMMVVPILAACATTPQHLPVTDVPPGNYVLVEPESDVYTAVAINENAHTVRMGDQTITGQHWLDAEGRLHIVPDTGECAGMESVWTYSVSGNRITMDQVSSECTVEGMPTHEVWERS